MHPSDIYIVFFLYRQQLEVLGMPVNMADSQVTVVDENGIDFSSNESLSLIDRGTQVSDDVKLEPGAKKVRFPKYIVVVVQ